MRGLAGLLGAIVLVAFVTLAALYMVQVAVIDATARLETARAERLEAQTMLQQARTIDAQARTIAGELDRYAGREVVLVAMLLCGQGLLIGLVVLVATAVRKGQDERAARQLYYYRRPVQWPMPEPTKRNGGRV